MADSKCWICQKSSNSHQCSWMVNFVPPKGAVMEDGKLVDCPDFEAEVNCKLWASPIPGKHTKLLIKECENCGKRIETYEPKRRFCSRECYIKYVSSDSNRKKRREKIKVCSICKNEFIAYGKEKYCSDDCRLLASRRTQKAYRERRKAIKNPQR